MKFTYLWHDCVWVQGITLITSVERVSLSGRLEPLKILMFDQGIHPNKFSELRDIYKYHIDAYITLYQLKTEKEEDLNSIYKMIKTELIDSKEYLPKNIIRDILNIIRYNNRYTKSYLFLAKLISDEYHLKEIKNIPTISNFLFYKEYGIKLNKSDDFEKIKSDNLDIHIENTIFKAIMNLSLIHI